MVVGVFLGVVTLVNQSREAALETTRVQASYEHEVLAREIARSASAMALSKAQQAGGDLDGAVGLINGTLRNGSPNYDGVMTGAQQGGSFNSQASLIDGQNVRIVTTGFFGEAQHTIEDTYSIVLLEAEDTSTVSVSLPTSMTNYCSAVFLQRIIPRGNSGHGNNEDGVDSSNEGGAPLEDSNPDYDDESGHVPYNSQAWITEAPEMVFESGRYRSASESTTTLQDLVLTPGTRLNFFIGVDRDCSEEGLWVENFNSEAYDWIHYALDRNASLYDFVEGRFAMVEQHYENDQRWRIAFEDEQDYSKHKLSDVKVNGYGGDWDPLAKTYGGTGWTTDADYYRQLEDFNWKPDFNDQVLDVTLNPCDGSCGLGGAVEGVVEEVVEVLPDLGL